MTGHINRLFLIIIFFTSIQLFAQEKAKNSVLLSGVVLNAEDGEKMSFVNISIRNTFYGTASDANGYFSLFINPGDTLEFSYVGYQDASFIMPFERQAQQYTLMQLMRKDTMMLEEVVIFQWPEYDAFVKAFLDTKPPKTMKDLIIEVRQDMNKTLDQASKSDYYYDQMRYQRLFIMHEIFPPNNFLDPSRWADFIRDLRRGEKKRGQLDDY